MATHYTGRVKYFVHFIDDFSHFIWEYTIKSKYKMFGNFKEFEYLVKNQSNKKIKCLRTDGGGKYISIDF